MEFVCKDDDGDWYFFPETGRYERHNNGALRARIKGESIPNPHRIFKMRRAKDPSARDCTEATYNLWEHWNAIVKKPD